MFISDTSMENLKKDNYTQGELDTIPLLGIRDFKGIDPKSSRNVDIIPQQCLPRKPLNMTTFSRNSANKPVNDKYCY
ncbi:hypothetical protein BH09BAC3_BH09BAC3_26430 [soil metagenome]